MISSLTNKFINRPCLFPSFLIDLQPFSFKFIFLLSVFHLKKLRDQSFWRMINGLLELYVLKNSRFLNFLFENRIQAPTSSLIFNILSLCWIESLSFWVEMRFKKRIETFGRWVLLDNPFRSNKDNTSVLFRFCLLVRIHNRVVDGTLRVCDSSFIKSRI